MKLRRAFTLVELIIAVFIFSYIAASLSTIYSTANRHMFQNYRRNIIKTDVLITMRSIQAGLAQATRLDLPAAGGAGNVLAFAMNVDKGGNLPTSAGCYPITNLQPATWHYYCRAQDPLIAGSFNLYYHTGTIAPVSGIPCGRNGADMWAGAYPVPVCGANLGGGQTVTLMMRHVSPDATMNGFLFSRAQATLANPKGVTGAGDVRVFLRSFWSAEGRGFGRSQRDIIFSLDSVLTSAYANPN